MSRTRSRANRPFRTLMFIRLALSLFIFSLFSPIVWVETVIGSTPWEQLAPEEQEILGPLQKNWEGIPTDRQNRLRKGASRWEQLSPTQRGKMKNRFQQWQQISPEKRARLRQRFQQFQSLPKETRQALRQKRQWFKSLPLERKQQIRKKWHGLSPDKRQNVRKRFGLDRPRQTPRPHSNRPPRRPSRNR